MLSSSFTLCSLRNKFYAQARLGIATSSTKAMATSSSMSASETHQVQSSVAPRRFAPLSPSHTNVHNAPALKGIVFDVDGTLCLPQNYMFREMREALLIPKSKDILDHIRELSEEPDGKPLTAFDPSTGSSTAGTTISSNSSPQSRAIFTVQAIERRAMTSQRPQSGLVELMTYITKRNLPKALCTRNFLAPVDHLLEHYLPGEERDKFYPIVTRDTEGILPKPSPEGIWRIAEAWGLDKQNQDLSSDDIRTAAEQADGVDQQQQQSPQQEVDVLELAKRWLGSGLIMVGDSIDDMAAGHRAGAATVLLVNEENEHLAQHDYTDLTIKQLDELIEILETGFEGRVRHAGESAQQELPPPSSGSGRLDPDVSMLD